MEWWSKLSSNKVLNVIIPILSYIPEFLSFISQLWIPEDVSESDLKWVTTAFLQELNLPSILQPDLIFSISCGPAPGLLLLPQWILIRVSSLRASCQANSLVCTYSAKLILHSAFFSFRPRPYHTHHPQNSTSPGCPETFKLFPLPPLPLLHTCHSKPSKTSNPIPSKRCSRC